MELKRVPPCLPAEQQLRGNGQISNSKEEVKGYVMTGVTSIPRHLGTIMCPFFLDVGRDACGLPSKHSVPHGSIYSILVFLYVIHLLLC